MSNYIYRFLDENRNILYIGKTRNLKERMMNHNHLPKECYEQRMFVEYVEFPTLEDMNIVERVLIATLKPPYNKEFKENNITIHIEELSNLKWELYDLENKNKVSTINEIELKDGLYLVQIIHKNPYIVGSVKGLIPMIENNDSIEEEFDDLLEKAAEVVIECRASASLLQRELKIGFVRAARILEQLEQLGIVGESEGCKVREVLVTDIEQAKLKIKEMKKKSICDS